MTALDIEFYCFAVCVIGFPIALGCVASLWWDLRKSRANEAKAILALNAEVKRAGDAETKADRELRRADSLDGKLATVRKHNVELAEELGPLKAQKAKRSAAVSQGNRVRYAKVAAE